MSKISKISSSVKFYGEIMQGITASMVILLVIILTNCISFISNPIPVPTLIMDREYIIISINYSRKNELLVNITGIYPFKNVGHKSVIMYFPIPPEALRNEVKVFFNDREIKWKVSEKNYATILGKYPMIYWELSDLPKNFKIKVCYKYFIKKNKEVFKLLYAMATGRYLNGTYTKQCIAEVRFRTINVPKEWIAKVSFVPPPSEAFGVRYESEVEIPLTLLDKIIVRRASRPFKGINKDILIVIIPKETVPNEKWVKYYPSKEEVKLSLNVTDTNTLKVLVEFTFRHGGFKVDVVEKRVEGSQVLLKLSVLEWTGPSIQVITKIRVKEEYKLKPGDYTFTLKIHDKVYYSQKIHIGGLSLLHLITYTFSPLYLVVILCIVVFTIVVILLVRSKYLKGRV